jgi:hypothetical protein
MAHLADLAGRHMAEDVPIKMNHAALPPSVRQILRVTVSTALSAVSSQLKSPLGTRPTLRHRSAFNGRGCVCPQIFRRSLIRPPSLK